MIIRSFRSIFWIFLTLTLAGAPLFSGALGRYQGLVFVNLIAFSFLWLSFKSIFSDRVISYYQHPTYKWLFFIFLLILSQLVLPDLLVFLSRGELSLFSFDAFGLRRTFAPHMTVYELMNYSAGVLLFIMVIHGIESERNISYLIRLLAGVMMISGVVGILQYLDNSTDYFWVFSTRGESSFFAGFPVENRFPAFAGMIFYLVAGRLTYLLVRYPPLKTRRRINEQVFLAFTALVTIASLGVCGSRGGTLIFLMTLPVYALLLATGRNKRLALGVLGFVAVSALAFFMWIGPEKVMKEFTGVQSQIWDVVSQQDHEVVEGKPKVSNTFQMRLKIQRIALTEVFPVNPFWGVGMGAFFDVYKTKMDPGMNFTHLVYNEWIEWLVHTGTLGFLLMLAIFFLYLGAVLPLLKPTGDAYIDFNIRGVLMALFTCVLMSCYDAMLHDRGNLFTFICIAAIGLRLRFFYDEMRGKQVLRVIRVSGAGRKVGLFLVLLVVFSGTFYITAFASYVEQIYLPKNIASLSSNQLLKYQKLFPWNAQLFFMRGTKLMTEYQRAMKMSAYEALPSEARMVGQYALIEIEKAINLNPMEMFYWDAKANIYRQMGRKDLEERTYQEIIKINPYARRGYMIYAAFFFREAVEECFSGGQMIRPLSESESFWKGAKLYLEAQRLLSHTFFYIYIYMVPQYEEVRHELFRQGIAEHWQLYPKHDQMVASYKTGYHDAWKAGSAARRKIKENGLRLPKDLPVTA